MCSKQKPNSSLTCLGILDHFGLTYLGIKAEKVIIAVDVEHCEQCNPGVITAVKQRIENANVVLHKLGRQAIQLVLRSEKADTKINRRELFGFCFSWARDTLLEMLPFSLHNEDNYRDLLINAINQQSLQRANQDLGPLFFGGAAKPSCNLCGICARSCKKDAFTIATVEETGHRQLLHNQSKCIGCLACTLLCPLAALQISLELSDARTICSKFPVVLASKKSCNRCGQVVAENVEVCETCLQEKTPYLQSIY